MKGLLARKIGMTHIISPEDGAMIPVTLLHVPENKILQVKTAKTDGYSACVLASFERNKKYKNTGLRYTFIKEVKGENEDWKKDAVLTVADFEGVEKVNITGVSKGRGFAGVIKRHNFARGRETHGSHHHREPGSSGMCAKPGRIIKGKRMPGHYGVDQQTIRSVKVVDTDSANNIIAVKGAVPGARNSFVSIIAA